MKQRPLMLITGAGGFTGRHACHYFAENGMEVLPISRSQGGKTLPYQTIHCDLLDEMAVDRLIQMTQPDYILHLAGLNDVRESWVKPMNYVKSNFNGTLHLLEAVRNHVPACHVCITGSALQYSPARENPPHPYSFSKTLQAMISEAWTHLLDMNILFAKPTNLIGPGHARGICSILAKRIVDMENGVDNNGRIHVNNLMAKRDFLDVRDVLGAYHMILLNGTPGKQYEIGTGTLRSIEDVVEQYRQLTTATFEITESERCKTGMTSLLDTSPVNGLGWQPKTAFSASLADTLDFYRSNVRE